MSRKHKAPSPSTEEIEGRLSVPQSQSYLSGVLSEQSAESSPIGSAKKPRLSSRTNAHESGNSGNKSVAGSDLGVNYAGVCVQPRRTVPGDVFVCGTGDCGQLGLGEDVQEKARPAILHYFNDRQIIDVVAGGMHNLALNNNGEVFSWGCNDDGALGRVTRKHTEDEMLPEKVQGLEGVRIARLAAGDSISVALSEDGFVYAWGTFRSSNGILGLDEALNTKSSNVPVKLSPHILRNIIDIAAGTNHIIALSSSGHILTWGSGEQNQLGRRCSPRDLKLALRPTDVTFIRSAIDAKYAGEWLSHLQEQGSSTSTSPNMSPYGSPASQRKQLVSSSSTSAASSPKRNTTGATGSGLVKSTKGPFLGVFAGGYHSFVLTRNFQLWACGLNNYGQTGNGTADQFTGVLRVPRLSFPVEISGRGGAGEYIVHIAAGEHHSLATTNSGRVFVFGRSDSNQLGLPSVKDRDSDSPTKDLTAAFAETSIGAFKPIPVLHPTLKDIALCGAAGQWSAAVSKDGQLFTWGYGDQGQLATGEFHDEETPIAIQLKSRKVLASLIYSISKIVH